MVFLYVETIRRCLVSIKEYLFSIGKSQQWLAEQVGAGQDMVSNWANGKVTPGMPYLRKLADLSDGAITPEDFGVEL